MNDSNDGILALLEDIKEMLLGIVLILLGIFLCVVSSWWWSTRLTVLTVLAGLFLLGAGLFHAYHGYRRSGLPPLQGMQEMPRGEAAEKQD